VVENRLKVQVNGAERTRERAHLVIGEHRQSRR
jgi:hypothetical protein